MLATNNMCLNLYVEGMNWTLFSLGAEELQINRFSWEIELGTITYLKLLRFNEKLLHVIATLIMTKIYFKAVNKNQIKLAFTG